jgi:hypothetical protein
MKQYAMVVCDEGFLAIERTARDEVDGEAGVISANETLGTGHGRGVEQSSFHGRNR